MKKDGTVYYPILEAELVKRGIRKSEIRKALNVEHSSFCEKLNGKRPFTLEQGLTIWKTWFHDIPIDELFRH
ncbi:MAG: hypothetical protein IJV26_07670 [Lachnospiraceae bacterium]|nr:hypothetical protein [Lachnospiraceae bacterium]